MTTGASSRPSPHTRGNALTCRRGNKLSRMCLSAHSLTAVPGSGTREVYGLRSMCPDQLWQAKGCVRPTHLLTLLLTVGGTHRQQSPGDRSNFPGNAWPTPLPQFIYTQKTASLSQGFPQKPKTNLGQMPPTTEDHHYHQCMPAKTSRERLYTSAPSNRRPGHLQ